MKRVIEAMSDLIEDRVAVSELFRLASLYSVVHSGLKPHFYEWLYKEILQASIVRMHTCMFFLFLSHSISLSICLVAATRTFEHHLTLLFGY